MKPLFKILLLSVLAAFSCLLPKQDVLAQSTDQSPIIRDIIISVNEVFEDDSGSFYRTVNKLKINTKREVIERELLFKAGDKFDQFRIDESERALRSLPYLRRVSITPLIQGEFVDIVVSVQDTWTLFPQFSFSSGGGTSKTEYGISENNLLGYGKQLEAFYADDEGRETFEGFWHDRRVLGTTQQFSLRQITRSDGFSSQMFYGQPFRTLVEPTSWSFQGSGSDLVERLFDNGDERFIFRNRSYDLSARYIISLGNPSKLLHRYSIGYQWQEDEFSSADDDDFQDIDVDPTNVSRDPALLADDRRFSGPFLVFERILPDFISTNYIDKFERVQDFNLGPEFAAKIFTAGHLLGSKEDTLIFNFSSRRGKRFSDSSFMRYEVGGTSRLDNEGFENSIAHSEVKFYKVFEPSFIGSTFVGKHTFASNFQFDYGDDLDRDRELLVGAENGLRGYEDRAFSGDKRFLLNLEDRVHLAEDVWRLLNLGGAFFIDVGGATNRSLGRLFSDEIYGDFGLGLRIGFPRSSGSTVLRIDIAFPWRSSDDGSGQFEPRLLASIGQMFKSQLHGESAGAERANLSLGLSD